MSKSLLVSNQKTCSVHKNCKKIAFAGWPHDYILGPLTALNIKNTFGRGESALNFNAELTFTS